MATAFDQFKDFLRGGISKGEGRPLGRRSGSVIHHHRSEALQLRKLKTQTPTPDELQMVERMKAKHVLRLDWHTRNEAGDKQSHHWNGKTYLDTLFGVLK